MTYSQEYYDCVNKIDAYKEKLKDLDSDYLTLKECTSSLAACGVLLSDMTTQCKDIEKVFDRGTIEGRYNACKIEFDTKNAIFSHLETIVNSTETFNSSCGDLKAQIEEYGSLLNDYGKSIADEAMRVKRAINDLNAQKWKYITPPEAPIPPEARQ